jgi:hypothetical protein
MTNTIRMTVPRAGENMLAVSIATSRQLWLATLGAASVTREWAGKEAGPVFRSLVAEGTNLESKLLRRVGRRLEANVSRAGALLRHARRGLESSAQTVASAAASLARRTMPRLKFEVAVEAPRARRATAPAKPAARVRKTAKAPAARKAAVAPVARKRRSARRIAAK